MPIEYGGPAIGRVARQGLDGSPARRLKRRFEHQIFGRITGDEQLGKGDDIGALARGLRAGLAGALEITGYVADDRVELRHGNGQTVGGTLVHGQGLKQVPGKWNRLHTARFTTPRRPAMASPHAGVSI